MEIFIEKQLISVGYSFILGLIFGASYDIIRIIHILCGTMSYSGGKIQMKRGKSPFVMFFLTDLLCMTALTAVFSVFVYYVNFGDFRWYLLFGAVVGFVLYYLTVGRVVMYFSDAVARLIRLVLRYTVAIPLMYLWRLIGKAAEFIYRHTIGRLVRAIVEIYLAKRNAKYLRHIKEKITFNIEQ